MSLHQKCQQPLVSIVIPTYNRPDYLKQAIASAIKQTYQNIAESE
ncbi:glycosyltransferase, partial [Nostoc sp. 'Peltigera malacea cyanobiont' DB3992]